MPARIPDLGPRGEGWVALQLILIVGTAVAGVAGGPAWSGLAREIGVVAGGCLLLLGGALCVRAGIGLGPNLTPFPRPTATNGLVETGVYARLRHPIYAGLIAAAIGWGLVTAAPAALALTLVLLLLFDAKARREEAWLAERHPGYAAYRSRTRRFVPGVY